MRILILNKIKYRKSKEKLLYHKKLKFINEKGNYHLNNQRNRTLPQYINVLKNKK